jgi:serine/threonine protein kinase
LTWSRGSGHLPACCSLFEVDQVADPTEPSIIRLPPEIHDDEAFQRKYLIERELGVGGAGVVVCARHRELDERVAIKFLLPGKTNPDAVGRFRREARAANRVKDEHVVRIIDVSTTSTGVPYVVMEYLDGIDLERMLLQSPERQLPVADAIEFILQACEALAECHKSGIVHRDLKPSNLFCVQGTDGAPLIKLLDFGISKLSSTTVDGVMTAEHLIMGSPRYMSPEQFASASDVDHRTDIWALGVILYELVTGEVPFADSTLLRIWDKVRTATPPPLEELRRDAPAALNPVLDKCLAKQPEDRYQTVAAFAKALSPFAAERGRNSVARVVRIADSERNGGTSPVPLPRIEDAPSDAPTIVSAGGEALAPRARRRVVIPMAALGGAALAAALTLWPATRETPTASTAPSVAKAAESAPKAQNQAVVVPLVSAELATPEGPPTSTVSAIAPVEPSSPPIPATPEPPARRSSAPIALPSATAESIASTPPSIEPVASVSAAPPLPSATAFVTPERSSAPVSSARTRAPEYLMDIVERRRPQSKGGKP